MPRSPRIHAPGAMYHVTLRGNHRQAIFFTPDDRSLLTRIVRDIIVECDAQLHAYCYMTNHVHALLQVRDTPLSRIMLLIAGRYARSVQARLETTGHLFEKRYHALLVDADEYLLTLLRYIHLNPVRAKLASSPDDYPWSSHHAYVGNRCEPWVTTEFALRCWARIVSVRLPPTRRSSRLHPRVRRSSDAMNEIRESLEATRSRSGFSERTGSRRPMEHSRK